MKKIISFSLFGNFEVYNVGAVENAKLAKTIYPGWICRFYHSANTDPKIIKQLQNLNCETISCSDALGKFDATLWRFRALNDPEVSVWISRDCDSRLNLREKSAVDEWLSTERCGHVMRDAKDHANKIMAGMFGINNVKFRERNYKIQTITDFISKNKKSINVRGIDQTFLEKQLWPIIVKDHISHDDWLRYKTCEFTTFKVKLPPGQFVGQVTDVNNTPITVCDRRRTYGA